MRLGPHRSSLFATIGIVYPNFGWIVAPDSAHMTFRVYQPRGRYLTELQSYAYVYSKSPVRVRERRRQIYVREMGPAGSCEMDDGANWQSIGLTNRGSITSNMRSNVSMGAGQEYRSADFPGQIIDGPSDVGHRMFYSRWAADVSG